jgi:deoxycytidine triphosphate deaminase
MMPEDINKLGRFGQYIKTNFLEKKNGGITITELSSRLGISRQLLYLVMTEKQPLSPALAMQLSNVLGESIEFWLHLGEINVNSHEFPEFYSNKTKEEILVEWAKMGSRTLVDKDIYAAHKNNIIEINPFDTSCLQPASYDLRIGDQIIISSQTSQSPVNLAEINVCALEPGHIAVLKTYEMISIPKYLLGRLGIMSDLSSNGIFVSHGIHVDPGFDGYLYVTLFNPGNSTYNLYYKNPFMTLEINYLTIEPHSAYEGPNRGRTVFKKEEISTVMRKVN